MKKILSIMLTLVLIFSLAACGGSDQSGGDTTAENAEKSEESGDSSSEDGTVERTICTGFWGWQQEWLSVWQFFTKTRRNVHIAGHFWICSGNLICTRQETCGISN